MLCVTGNGREISRTHKNLRSENFLQRNRLQGQSHFLEITDTLLYSRFINPQADSATKEGAS